MTHRLGPSSAPSALTLRMLACLVVFSAPVSGCFDPSDEDGAGDDAAAGTGAATGTGETGDEGTAGVDDGSDGAGGSTGGAADGAQGDAAQACAEYCELIGDHCDAELSQYSGTAVCEATCAQMSPGTPDDTLGNTVGCRSFHALLAARSPEPHCQHAGPTGDGTCGANCENFCALALSTCEGDLAPYADADACISACEGFATDPAYFSEAPDADTFACRMRHLTLAAAQPEVHCLHIGSDSPVCAD